MILLEGVRNLALPCTLALVVPGLVLALAGRGRTPVVTGAVLGSAAGVVWTGGWGAATASGTTTQLLGAAVLAGGLWLLAARRGTTTDALGATAASMVAALLWQPCVGPELGTALTAASTDPLPQVVPLVGYALGATLPLPVLGAGTRLAHARELPPRVGEVGLGLGGVLVLLLAAGGWDDVVGSLVRATLR